jgi:hypothetical protein
MDTEPNRPTRILPGETPGQIEAKRRAFDRAFSRIKNPGAASAYLTDELGVDPEKVSDQPGPSGCVDHGEQETAVGELGKIMQKNRRQGRR